MNDLYEQRNKAITRAFLAVHSRHPQRGDTIMWKGSEYHFYAFCDEFKGHEMPDSPDDPRCISWTEEWLRKFSVETNEYLEEIVNED